MTEPNKTTSTDGDSSSAAPPEPESRRSDPVRVTTWLVALLVVLLFTWYIASDRYAPWTDQARVEGWIVPIAPKVSGRVVEVAVTADQRVAAGDLLARIDPRDYALAVERAESNLDLARQQTGADTAGVESAEAAVAQARADLAKRKADVDRYDRIFQQDPGAISASTRERAAASYAAAQAALEAAEAERERARQQRGATGDDNARLREAEAALEQARIDLAETRLLAPSDGGITNLKIDEGQRATAGTPLMTFVSATDVWVKAYLRENSIGQIEPGDPVEIVLDALPGRVLPGTVASVGFAVSVPSGGAVGEVETVRTSSGWLRDAQRFPVIIRFDDDGARGFRRYGGQADVQIYAGENGLLNALGRLWIRLMSVLSYVY